MAPVKLVDFDPDLVDPQNPPYGMELSKGYFGVYQPARRNEPPQPRQGSEVIGLGLPPGSKWPSPYGLPFSSVVRRSPDDTRTESPTQYGYLHNDNGLLNIYEDHRVDKRAPDARKPDLNAQLSASSLAEREAEAKIAEKWLDFKREAEPINFDPWLHEREHAQLDGPFTVYDLSKRDEKNPWVGHGGRLDRDTEPKKEMTAEEVKAQLEDLGEPFFHYVDDRVARSTLVGRPYPGGAKPGHPSSASTRDVDGQLARWSGHFDPAGLDHRQSSLEERAGNMPVSSRDYMPDDAMQGTSKVIYGLVIVTMAFAIIGVVTTVYSCFKKLRRRFSKQLGRSRSGRHSAATEADKVDVPEISQTAPEGDLEENVRDVEPVPGPAIADQLPTDGEFDRATGKRVSFNVPVDDTVTGGLGSPHKRDFGETQPQNEEEASPASPR